ncbi:O-antigen ligase family protein [Clostridium niameyense]|uniref:O-antigen ligase family protein n=1 Tax=Clostridium niameyense TaxID=1622073 RepID=UPI0013EC7F5E|nr:O-antigen ligase family protein [Clostridium niameyense]
MILSIFIANNKIVAFDYMLRYMLMLAIFIMMIIENRNRKELNETFKFLLLFYIGMLFLGGLEVCGIKYGLSNIFMDKHMTSSYLTRIPEVFFYNPNNYSIVLDVGIAALFIRSLFVESRRERLFYYFLIFVSEIELIFASSRIAWIVLYGTFILIFLLGFVTIKNDKKLGKKSIINSMVAFMLSFVLFFCLALLPSMAPYYKKFADSIIINNVREAVLPDGYVNKIKIEEDHNIDAKIKIGGKGSENERVTLIKNVIDGVIVEKNYLGFGVGNIGVYIKNKANTYGIINVHSFWFEFLGDFGIPMFIYLIIIYCIMLLDTFKLYWNKQGRLKQYYMILLLLGIIMVPLAFSPSSVMTVSPFWIILGMNFGIVSVK